MEKKEKKLRILVTGFTSNRGGVETFVINYIKAIRKIAPNIFFDVLGYEEHPAFADEIRECGGKIYTVPSPRHFYSRKELNAFFRSHVSEYNILWCNKCDLGNIDYLKMAKKYGIPRRILHSHSSSNKYNGIRRILFPLLHRMNKNRVKMFATDFWACSDYAAKWLFPKEILEKECVKYIPNAVDLQKFAPDAKVRDEYRKRLGIGIDDTVYIFVGRLGPIKNPQFAIDIFAEIWRVKPESVFLIVGAGELENSLKQKIAHESYGSYIQFLGSRNDVYKLLQAADCYLMPSLFEGFPVGAIEAQAAGLPVFAASDGITTQAQLTPLFHFLPLSAGAGQWAEEILKCDLSRKDCRREMYEKGFDVERAAGNLKKYFYEMVGDKEQS